MARQNWLLRITAAAALTCCLLQGGVTAQPRSRGPADFLRRLDTNGNGMIDLNEMQGPASFMIQRLARDNPSINTSRPISIDALSRQMDRMRQQRGGDDRRGSSDRRSSSSSSRTPEKEVEPLVPGFGIEDDLPPIPGFGDLGEFFSVKVTDQDKQSADRSFRYYDRNQDGKIDSEEMSRSRSGDLKQYDKNGDGTLTKTEMAVRYARRRLDQEQQSQSSSRSSSSRGSSSSSDRSSRFTFSRSSSSSSDGGSRDRRSGFSSRGSRDGSSSSDGGSGDRREAIMSFFRNRGGENGSSSGRDRSRRGGFGSRDGGDRGRDGGNRSDSPKKSDSGDSDRKSYRFLTPGELLPSGVPQWFIDRDSSGDSDGQVQMSEYASRWTDALAEEFSGFDGNGDGIITPKEVMVATDLGALPGSGGSGSYSSGRYSSKSDDSASLNPPGDSANPPASANPPDTSGDTNKTDSSNSTGDSPIDSRTLGFFRKVLTQSDTNKDGALTKEEWSKMSKDPSAADANSDGRITVEEYARWKTKR